MFFANMSQFKGRYSFEVKAKEDITDVMLTGIIGDWWEGYDAGTFIEKLRSVETSHINLRISSPGGDYYDSLAIYRALRDLNTKTTAYLSGLVASGGTLAAAGCDKTYAAPELDYMVHGVQIGAFGTVNDFEDIVEQGKKNNENIAKIYAKKSSKKDIRFFRGIINSGKDKWMNADEAKAIGLIDGIKDDFKFAACALPSEKYFTETLKVKNIPDHIRKKISVQMEDTIKVESPAIEQEKENKPGLIEQVKGLVNGSLVAASKLEEAESRVQELEKEVQEAKAMVENSITAEAHESLQAKLNVAESKSKELSVELDKIKAENDKLKKANEAFASEHNGEIIDVATDEEDIQGSVAAPKDKWEQLEDEAAAIDKKNEILNKYRSN